MQMTMLPPSPGITMGKLNLKPELAKTWGMQCDQIFKGHDPILLKPSFITQHDAPHHHYESQSGWQAGTPIMEWLILSVASCCLSTSPSAAQGLPASTTTWLELKFKFLKFKAPPV